MQTRDIYDIWASGVMRWHASAEPALARSGDTTDAHAARCLRLLLCLWPGDGLPPADLMAAVLLHDAPECAVGDVPGPAKTGPLHDALVAAEDAVAVALGLVDIGYATLESTPEDYAAWVRLVDMLDAHLWAYLNAPDTFYDAGWAAVRRDSLLPLSAELGVRQHVSLLLDMPLASRRDFSAMMEDLENG